MVRGPVLTLLAVFAVGAVMLGINVAASEPETAPDTTAAAATPAASAGAPTSTTAAAPAPFPARARFVGEAQAASGTIPVSITVDGDRAKVYVCDNRRIEAWL
jgi:hypothetical protein